MDRGWRNVALETPVESSRLVEALKAAAAEMGWEPCIDEDTGTEYKLRDSGVSVEPRLFVGGRLDLYGRGDCHKLSIGDAFGGVRANFTLYPARREISEEEIRAYLEKVSRRLSEVPQPASQG